MMPSVEAPSGAGATGVAWRSFTLAAAPVAFVLVAFWPTTWSMAEIWLRSETYQHCLLVLPLFGWMVWRERHRLAALPVLPWWPGIAGVLVLGVLWQFGRLAGANVVAQFAVVGIAIAAFTTVTGLRWARALAFPLGFLFFAVPFGEVLVPVLMDWTADVTVAAVRLFGVPVYREGTHFIIPSGSWSVIEACSGLKYLIASLAAGTLYAWVIYHSPLRRLLFVAAATTVPVVANWLRASSIVMIGHASNNKWMTGPEHIVFGWILFGAAMLVLFWVGSYWREEAPISAESMRRPAPSVGSIGAARPIAMLAAALAVLLWPTVDAGLSRPFDGPVPHLPRIGPNGAWHDTADAAGEWKPHLVGPIERSSQSFRRGDRIVGLQFGLFHAQRKGAELASSVNSFIEPDDRRWKITAVQSESAASLGIDRDVRSAMLHGQNAHWLVWHWYWINGIHTTSELRAKYELAVARVSRRPDSGVWIAIYTRIDDEPAVARAALADFVRQTGPAADSALAQMVQR